MSSALWILIGILLPLAVVLVAYAYGRFGLWLRAHRLKGKWVFAVLYLAFGFIQALTGGSRASAGAYILIGAGLALSAMREARARRSRGRIPSC